MASIRDIAKMAGVSPASVSRILNNDPSFSINKNTRSRVIEIANRVQYSKKNSERGPKSAGKKMTIGLILRHDAKTELSDPYFHEIHEGIEEEAAKWRLHAEVAFTMHEKNKDWKNLSAYGAVIMVGEMTVDAISKVKKYNKNLILIDATPSDPNLSYICNDFVDKTYEILNYLYSLGHRNIAYIGGRSSIVDENGKTIYQAGDARANAYHNWMKLKGLDKYDQALITNWSTHEGLQSANNLLKLSPRPSAVVVGSDPMALGVYKAFSNHQINIPQDISIVSFDDVEMTQYLTPTLSSVYINADEMGKLGVRLAKSMISEEVNASITVTVHSQLKIRESIAKKK